MRFSQLLIHDARQSIHRRCYCQQALHHSLPTAMSYITLASVYLVSSFQRVSDVTTRRHLRSAATSQLIVPATRCLTLGDRAFSVAAARAWNALPHSVTSPPTLPTFRRLLDISIPSQFLFVVLCLSNGAVPVYSAPEAVFTAIASL